MFPRLKRILFFLFLLGIVFLAGCAANTTPPPDPPPVCEEEWFCDSWSACENGSQSRTCTEVNNCTNPPNQPPVVQRCNDPVTLPTEVSVSVGEPTRLFDSKTQHCGTSVIEGPDIPVSAIRNYQNEIVLISGNAPDNYAMVGSDFDHLVRDCSKPILVSEDKWPITDFAPQQWLNGVYTENGKDVFGLVHNEYHDPYSANCNPGETTPANRCWYNFITAATSTDGGHTFTQLPKDQKVVAILPTQWNASDFGDKGVNHPLERPDPQGYFSPTFIKKDDYYYSTFGAIVQAPPGKNGMCIMRTQTPENPHSWMMWDGNGFTLQYYHPYPNETSNPDEKYCALVSPDTLWNNSGPITYNTYLEKYLMVLTGIFPWQEKNDTCGIWYSTSDDLLHWEKPKLIMKTRFDFYPGCEPTTFNGGYVSIIDHDSSDPNFKTSGQTPYLYYVLGDVPPRKSFSILERRLLTFTKS